jgi:hypothetical protein
MQPFRLAVYTDSRKLLGYWWLREWRGGYAVTYRDPITRAFDFFLSDNPEEVVQRFFQTYTDYLKTVISQLDSSIANVPNETCLRPGFRPDHFRRLRRELISRRAQLICRSRERYAEAVVTLRSRGWPPIPAMPCLHTDTRYAD